MVKTEMEDGTHRIKAQEFRDRTKALAVSILRLYPDLPATPAVQIVAKQLVRSGTSVAANFREACRARSKAEFISKVGTCEQEADETQLWLELLRDGCWIPNQRMDPLWKECDEIISILVTMSKRAKGTGER